MKKTVESNPEPDFLIQVFNELHLIKDHPRMLILISHGFIELLINALIDNHLRNCKIISDDGRSYPHSVKLLILNELSLLSDKNFILLNRFRKLRNDAAHMAIFKVKKSVLSQFEVAGADDEKLFNLCVKIIVTIWNSNTSVFLPKFAPSVTNISSEKT